jgi:hypothetical protein
MENAVQIGLTCIVIAIVAAAIYEAGRTKGEAGVLKQLQVLNASVPTKDAVEGLITSVPGVVVENIINKIVDTYVAGRAFIPTEQLKAIGDEAGKFLRDVSDGQPNTAPDPAFVASIPIENQAVG